MHRFFGMAVVDCRSLTTVGGGAPPPREPVNQTTKIHILSGLRWNHVYFKTFPSKLNIAKHTAVYDCDI